MNLQQLFENAQHVHTIGGYIAIGVSGTLAVAGALLLGFGIYRSFFKNVGMTSVADLGPAVSGIIGFVELLGGALALALAWIVLSSAFSG